MGPYASLHTGISIKKKEARPGGTQEVEAGELGIEIHLQL